MDRISSETFKHILQYLGPPELKSFRLVCRSFATIAAGLLFREVRLFANKVSFDALQDQISTMPALRQHARSLLYDARQMYDIYDDDDDDEDHHDLSNSDSTYGLG